VAVADSSVMRPKLALANPKFQLAEQFESDIGDLGGMNRSLLLMALLICFLIGEQLLAYFASYHPAPVAASAPVSLRQPLPTN